MRRPIVLIALALGVGASAGAASAQGDVGGRYGPSEAQQMAAPIAYAPTAYAPGASSAPRAAAYGRVLVWPGKVVASRAPALVQSYSAPRAAGALMSAAPAPSAAAYGYRAPQTAPILAGAPEQGWRPVFAARGPAPFQGAPLPTSIYAAPAAQPSAPLARAAPPPQGQPAYRRYGYDPTQDHSVRFYSVHRPFGMKPDPAPIPPQFFTATADLSEPPGPLPVNHTTAANRAAAVNTTDAGGQ